MSDPSEVMGGSDLRCLKPQSQKFQSSLVSWRLPLSCSQCVHKIRPMRTFLSCEFKTQFETCQDQKTEDLTITSIQLLNSFAISYIYLYSYTKDFLPFHFFFASFIMTPFTFCSEDLKRVALKVKTQKVLSFQYKGPVDMGLLGLAISN